VFDRTPKAAFSTQASVRDDQGRFRFGVRVLQDITARLALAHA
jgi:hypothetical protein